METPPAQSNADMPTARAHARATPVFGIASVLCPVLGVVLGVALAFGGGTQAGAAGGILIAATVTLVAGTLCAIASWRKKERWPYLAGVGLLLSVGPFIYLVGAILVYRQELTHPTSRPPPPDAAPAATQPIARISLGDAPGTVPTHIVVEGKPTGFLAGRTWYINKHASHGYATMHRESDGIKGHADEAGRARFTPADHAKLQEWLQGGSVWLIIDKDVFADVRTLKAAKPDTPK